MHYRSVVDFFDDRGQGSYQLNLLLKRSQNNLFQNIQPDTMLEALSLGFIAIGSALVINEIFRRMATHSLFAVCTADNA